MNKNFLNCFTVLAVLSLTPHAFAYGALAPIGNTAAPQPSTNMHPQVLQSYIQSKLSTGYTSAFDKGFSSVCRNYGFLSANNKKEALAVFITAIAFAESGLNSYSKFREPFGVWSLGLFQTSYEDKAPYGCPYNRAQDQQNSQSQKSIFKTENQIQCFLNVSNKLFANPTSFPYLRKIAAQRGHRSAASLNPMEKLSAYWSIFRPSNRQGANRFYVHIHNYMPKFCN
jgi:hypothetical protein